MPNEEARQAKALEGIERHMKELVRVFATVNENFVGFVKMVREMDQFLDQDVANPDQMTIDELRAKEELKYVFDVGDIVRVDEKGSSDHDRVGQVITPEEAGEIASTERLGIFRVSFPTGRVAYFKWNSLRMVRKLGDHVS